MPLPPDAVELREVFREEVRDLLELLEAQLAVLPRSGGDLDARRRAIAEVYRVVHSLKGAARAVAMPALERLLHEAEGRIGPARQGAESIADEVLRVGAIVLDALRKAQPAIDALGEPPPEVLQDAHGALEGARPTTPHAVVAAPAPPEGARAAEPPAADRPSVDTVRVASSRLEDLSRGAEAILGLVARLEDGVRGDRLESALAELRGELGRARARLRATVAAADASAAVERALNLVQTIQALDDARRGRERADLRALRSGVDVLVERARALRLARLSALSWTIERVADEAATALDRRVRIELALDDVEVDRRIVEGLREPLLHLVRNAIDHGVEPPDQRRAVGKPERATLRVEAHGRGRDVVLTVEDDGRGFDQDALREAAEALGIDGSGDPLHLAFLPGVSTKGEATALSGRGMGLDVVRERIADLHGRIEVRSERGRGTRFVMHLPVDLSLARVLLVRVRDVELALVTTTVERLVRLREADLSVVEERVYANVGDAPIPVADLAEVLGIHGRGGASGAEIATVVVVAASERRVALRVDEALDEREVVLEPLGRRIRRAPFVAGATLVREGDVVLVLDAGDLVRLARPAARAVQAPAARRARILVVDDSVTTRQLERAILEAAGYEVVLAHDGQQAWETIVAADRPFDLVVSDIEMPRIDGYGLVARIRATPSTTRLPIVLVTALAQESDRRRALELGADAYVVKGRFDQAELLETIETLL